MLLAKLCALREHFLCGNAGHAHRFKTPTARAAAHVSAGHHSEIWGLAISSGGTFLCSGSHDKSIRIWDQTDEQVFLEEEREKELEEVFEAGIEQVRETNGFVCNSKRVQTRFC
eukprot:SAG11_NODE_258_length_11542_cov_35.970899_9_plen_114_part_00